MAGPAPTPVVSHRPDGVTLINQQGVTGPNGQESIAYVDLGDATAVNIEVTPQGGGGPSASIIVEDSFNAAAFSQALDTAGYTPSTAGNLFSTRQKFNVTGTRRYVKVILYVTGGTWVVTGSPVYAPNQENVTVAGTTTANQGTPNGGGAAAWPVVFSGQTDVSDRAGRALGQVSGVTADGSPPTGNPVLTAGFDGTNTQTISTDTSGRPVVNVNTLPASATQSTIEQKVRAGEAFAYSPGKLAVGAASNGRVLISNPNASGKTLYVYSHFFTADAAGVAVAGIFKNPSTGLPALGAVGAGIANQNDGSATTSVAKVGADTNATALASGSGSQITSEAVVGIARTAYPAALYVIPANSTLGFNVPFTAATGLTPEFFWWEE